MSTFRSSPTEPLSPAAQDRKHALLPALLSAQAARVRRRRVASIAATTTAAVALVSILTVTQWPARNVQLATNPPTPHTPINPEPPTAPTPPSPAPEPQLRVAIVHNDPTATADANIDDAELQRLLAEAGEPTGFIRSKGRVFAGEQLAALNTPGM
ncbi:MAG: hypothetical protein JSR77_11400 [Planctomycetes bacterium]|nr:hypothetical protein [Planctomycetota bacterium]